VVGGSASTLQEARVLSNQCVGEDLSNDPAEIISIRSPFQRKNIGAGFDLMECSKVENLFIEIVQQLYDIGYMLIGFRNKQNSKTIHSIRLHLFFIPIQRNIFIQRSFYRLPSLA
jgi:hypothetical protein